MIKMNEHKELKVLVSEMTNFELSNILNIYKENAYVTFMDIYNDNTIIKEIINKTIIDLDIEEDECTLESQIEFLEYFVEQKILNDFIKNNLN